MSYLALHSRTGGFHLSGREVANIQLMAERVLARELARPEYRRLRAELELPPPGTEFYFSQVSWLAGDGEAHRVQGQDVYLFDLAFTLFYQEQAVAGILCWLFDQALGHGWIAAADQQAFAAEIQAALDAGVARAKAADRHQPAAEAAGVTILPGNRDGWEDVIAFLRGAPGDVVTSLSFGNEFPDHRLAWEAGTWRPGVRDPEDPGEELEILWDQVSAAGQWDLSMRALRTQPSRQWRPGGRYVFGEFTLEPEAGLVRIAEPAR